jgi:hypothetical protein
MKVVENVNKDEGVVKTYPRILKSTVTGSVIFARDTTFCFILVPGEGAIHPVGYVCTYNKDNYEDFEGEIVLSNDG